MKPLFPVGLDEQTNKMVWSNGDENQTILLPIGETPDSNPNALQTVNEHAIIMGDDSDESDDEMRVISDIRAALGDDPESLKTSSVRVYRYGENRKLIFLHKFEPTNFDIDQIQTLFGGGSYRIKVYGIHPETKRGTTLLNRDFECADPIGGVKQVINNEPSTTDKLLMTLIEKMDKPAQVAVNPLEHVGPIIALAKALNGGPINQVDPLDQLTKLLTVQGLMRDSLPVPETPGNDTNALLQTGLGLMTAIMSKQNEPQPIQHAVPPQITAAPVSQTTSQPAPQLEPDEEMKFMMQFAIKRVLGAAQANVDPGEFLQSIEMVVSDDMLYQFASPDNWFDNLLQISPEAVNYREWLTRLRETIMSSFSDETETDPNVPTAPVPATAPRASQ